MVLKLILVAICALLLVICYRTRAFAEKILRLKDDRVTDKLILKIKCVALGISMAIFIFSIIFVK